MANTTITGLPVGTAVTADDILPFVNDPLGTAVTQKITTANFIKSALFADLMCVDFTHSAYGGGTAVSDNTAALEAAMATLPVAGGNVWIPPGIYNFTTTPDIPEKDNIRIFGSKASILRWNNATASPILRHNLGVGIKRLVLEGFSVDGNHSICTGLIANYELFRIAHVESCWIENLAIWDSPGTAIYCGAGSGVTSSQIFVLKNDIKNVGCNALDDGSSVEGINIPPNDLIISEIIIASNHIRDETSRTDATGGCTGMSVEANSGGTGQVISIVNNTLYNLRGNAIKLGPGAADFSVAGNTIRDVGDIGGSLAGGIIIVNDADVAVRGGSVVGNTLTDMQAQGIRLGDECDNVLVANNTIEVNADAAAIVVADDVDDYVLAINNIRIINTGTSARGILAGSGSGAQNRGWIFANRIHLSVVPTGGELIVLSALNDLCMIEHNVLTNSSGTTTDGIKIGNGNTNTRLIDNHLGVNLNYNLGSGSYSAVHFIDRLGNVVMGTAALATNATSGFLYLPSSAGAPTGVPTAYTGRIPMEVDTTNGRVYFYYGAAWHYVALT